MRRAPATVALLCALATPPAAAHDGPPFPIVTDHETGPYLVTVWTDPDTTDDGSAGGQFWVQLVMRDGRSLPDRTRATIVASRGQQGGQQRTPQAAVGTEPVNGDVTNQFGAVVLDREGHFTIDVRIAGPAGAAGLTAGVDATYDLRPPVMLLPLYVMPFALVGFLWIRVLLRRRQAVRPRVASETGTTAIHTQPSGRCS